MDALTGRYAVHQHEPLGHEPLERLEVYNEAFDFHVSNGSMPQMAVAEFPVTVPLVPLPKMQQPRRDDDRREQKKSVNIYPITAENMGEVPSFTNFFVPRKSILRVIEPTSPSSDSDSSSSSDGSNTLDCLPQPRLASPRRCADDTDRPYNNIAAIPLSRSCISPGKRRQQSSLGTDLESKAVPSMNTQSAVESKAALSQSSAETKMPLKSAIVVAEAAVPHHHPPTSTLRTV